MARGHVAQVQEDTKPQLAEPPCTACLSGREGCSGEGCRWLQGLGDMRPVVEPPWTQVQMEGCPGCQRPGSLWVF